MSRAAKRSLFCAGGTFSGQCAVPFFAFQKRRLALILAVGVLLLTAQCTSAVITKPTKSNVNLRSCASSQTCRSYVVIPEGTYLTFQCRETGEVVSGDPWWLYTYYCWYAGPSPGGVQNCVWGYVSDYYVDCGGNYCTPLPAC